MVYKYCLLSPSTGMEPHQSVNLGDYYDVMKRLIKINKLDLDSLYSLHKKYDIRKENSAGQDYFIVNLDSSKEADNVMKSYADDFRKDLLDHMNKSTNVTALGQSLEQLAKLNYFRCDKFGKAENVHESE